MNKLPSSLFAFADKIALELVFAEPGKDAGLLPINSLLSEIENLASAESLPESFCQALSSARQCVDAALESGAFDQNAVQQLSAWSAWMREAQAATAQDQPLPPPLEFRAPAGAAPTETAPAAPEESALGEEPLVLDLGNAELLREFVEEAQEHLQQIELDVLALEKNPADTDTLNSLFRSFHTLKGGSGFLHLVPMNRLAHELEALLHLTREGKLQANRPWIELILAGRDVLRQFVAEIARRLSGEVADPAITIPIQLLVKRARELQQRSSDAEASAPALDSTPVAAQNGARPSESQPVSTAVLEARRTGASVLKVDTAKLDNLIDLIGELVVAQSLVVQDNSLRAVQSQHLGHNLVHLSRITNDLQRIAMSLRMVPIRGTFQKLTRLVRDVAGQIGKQIELEISGEETELDRSLVEEIGDPLIHMIRNAVDHGIESPAQRQAAGKPLQGTIRLRAFHQGGNIVIEIEDDGAGLNAERILAKAIKNGLVAEGAPLSQEEIYQLIFAPGLSTADKVTEISGRGVGMDVVLRNVNKLRGKITVRSELGKGSTFSIYLPLTLAIIDGLVVSIGSERFIVPTLSVRESFRPQKGMISTVHARGEMVSVRGQFSPMVRLYERFGLQPETTDPTQAIVVVVETNHQPCCLMVDRLLGKQEVVIKGLGALFKQSQGLAGAAILGDGRVGLILDVNGLVEASGRG